MIYIDRTQVPQSRDAILREGDIIVVRSGAYTGDSALVPPRYHGAVAGYDMVLSVVEGDKRFYAWTLLSSWVRDYQFALQKLRAAQPHLNAAELGETLVCVPPVVEQRAIVEYIDWEITTIHTTIEKARAAINLLREHRTSLISAAVTGKIDIRIHLEAELEAAI